MVNGDLLAQNEVRGAEHASAVPDDVGGLPRSGPRLLFAKDASSSLGELSESAAPNVESALARSGRKGTGAKH